jgi:hypothetical protein
MTPTTTISGFIDSSDKKITLGTEVWIDNICVVNVEHVDRVVHFSHVLEEDNAEHELRIVMKHKTPDHTELDDAGNIIRDAMLSISDIKFDEIALGQVLLNKAVYTHDFNGSQPPVDDKFFGDLGCNGTVSLKFTTPAYLWLLENM